MSDEREKLELLDRILEMNLNWISSADSKGTQIFAIDSAMLAVLAALVPPPGSWTISAAIFSAISLLALVSGIIFIALANFPRLKGPRNSLVFFRGIASHEESQYVGKILAGVTDELLRDWASQCHRNAEIAKEKYKNIRMAVVLQFAALPFWLVSIWLMYAL